MSKRGVTPMCSHLPLLGAVIASLHEPGNLLELGAGAYSTPLMHLMGKVTRRAVLTLDSDAEWIERLSSYRRPHHAVEYHPKPWTDERLGGPWALAFVDNAAHERGPCLSALHHVPLIVVHDTEACHLDQYAGFREALGAYRYRFDLRLPEFPNQTSVLSDTLDVSGGVE